MASGAYDKNDQFIFIGLGTEDTPEYVDRYCDFSLSDIICIFCEHIDCVCGGEDEQTN